MFQAPLRSLAIIPLVFTFAASFATVAVAQQAAASSTTTCTLEDGRQIYVRYTPVASSKEKVANGKPFIPGGTPMTLFPEAELPLGSSVIPVGAYSLYPIPDKSHWALVVNKNVTPGAAYDEKQDLARTQMETEQVPEAAAALELVFAHVGSKCSLRIYYGKSASFADFTAK
jgi:hypothetical protein